MTNEQANYVRKMERLHDQLDMDTISRTITIKQMLLALSRQIADLSNDR